MSSENNNIEGKMLLIENIYNYIEDIINNKIEYKHDSTINSLKNIIFKYYTERYDYDSNYFDPYAYVNDMNENILDDKDINYNKLFKHFNNYVSKIIDGEITELESLKSIFRIIKFYYNERYDNKSKYFDMYAFNRNLNNVLDELEYFYMSDSEYSNSELEISDSEYESTTEEETDEEDDEIDPYLLMFMDESKNNNDDVFLYNKSIKPINKLNHFLELNKYY